MAMKFCINPYTDGTDELETLQYRILLNSYIYYEMNNNIISDRKFDEECKQYLSLVEKYGEDVLKRTRYYHAFAGFNGCTGFDLCEHLTEDELFRLKRRARIQLSYHYGLKK